MDWIRKTESDSPHHLLSSRLLHREGGRQTTTCCEAKGEIKSVGRSEDDLPQLVAAFLDDRHLGRRRHRRPRRDLPLRRQGTAPARIAHICPFPSPSLRCMSMIFPLPLRVCSLDWRYKAWIRLMRRWGIRVSWPLRTLDSGQIWVAMWVRSNCRGILWHAFSYPRILGCRIRLCCGLYI